MFQDPTFMCIDAGSENCPCYLAESGNCLVCGRLSGKDCSDCKWHGVCIYNEYIQNNRRLKRTREDFEAKIIERICFENDVILLGLKVEKGFALKCYSSGTYVFLRGKDREQFFNVPISVMRVDVERGEIFLLVKCISAKTKSILNQMESLIIRGPYKNGVLGYEDVNNSLKTAKNEGRRGRLMIAARATGIAPASKMVQCLGDKNYVTLIVDPAGLSPKVMEEVLIDEPEDYMELDFTREIDLFKIKLELAAGGYDALVIFASDYYIKSINELAKDIDFQGTVAISNNFNICCGEGICGACSVHGKNGETMKMCKCRLSANETLELL